MSEQANEPIWYWLRPDRQQAEGSFEELTRLLSSRALPRSTMVWLEPWPEWRPAHRVPELASVLPPSPGSERASGSAEAPRVKVAAPKVPRPEAPRPTHSAPPRLIRPTGGAAGGGLAKTERAAQKTAASVSEPATGPAATPEPAADAPAAAVSPAPLAAVLAANHHESFERAHVELANPAPQAAAPGEPEPAELPSVEEDAELSAQLELDAAPQPARLPSFDDRHVAVSSEAPVAFEPRFERGDAARPVPMAFWASAAGCALLLAAFGFSLRALSAAHPPDAVAAPQAPPPLVASQPPRAVAAPQLATPAALPGCTLLTPPARLAQSIERDVMPSLAALDAEHVAIGFAGSRTEARGVVVNLTTLDARATFSQSGKRAVLGVAANPSDGKSFAVDRDDGTAASAATLDAERRTIVAVRRDAIVRRSAEQRAVTLWPFAANSAVTAPRVARLGERSGYALALREGGASGQLRFGWLDAAGAPRGELQRIDAGVRWLGSPALAASEDGALVAFAGRDSEAEPWRLRLARVAAGGGVSAVSDFALGAEDLGAGAIAPALAAFDGKRWLLQWTQGEPGRLRVRVQMLNEALRPIAAPLPVSPMGANAGQGSVWAFGERVLSLFLWPVPGRDELWGSVLRCR